jgi:hypothetical protein
MAFDFASAKALLRRTVHDTLAVEAFYEDDSMSVPAPIRARWHNKIDRFGDPESMGYAEYVQGVDRIILFPGDTPLLTFRKGGRVRFPAYGNTFKLDVLETRTGALQQVWIATAT